MKTYTQNHPKARYIFFIFCHANALFALPIPRLAFYLPSKCQCTVCTRQQSNVSTGSRTQCNLVVRELFFPCLAHVVVVVVVGNVRGKHIATREPGLKRFDKHRFFLVVPFGIQLNGGPFVQVHKWQLFCSYSAFFRHSILIALINVISPLD